MSNLHWIVRNNWNETTRKCNQTRENVYGEMEALRRLIEIGDKDAYIWTPGAYAIEYSEARRMLRQAEGRHAPAGY